MSMLYVICRIKFAGNNQSLIVRLSLTLQRQDLTIGYAKIAIAATRDFLKQFNAR